MFPPHTSLFGSPIAASLSRAAALLGNSPPMPTYLSPLLHGGAGGATSGVEMFNAGAPFLLDSDLLELPDAQLLNLDPQHSSAPAAPNRKPALLLESLWDDMSASMLSDEMLLVDDAMLL